MFTVEDMLEERRSSGKERYAEEKNLAGLKNEIDT
jgi:hypothetical protein